MPINHWQERRKMTTKGHGIRKMSSPLVSEYKPESTMQLEGDHATTVKSHAIGQKVKMQVIGTKTRGSLNDGKHSSSYKIHSVKMTDADETGGPNGKSANNDKDNSDSRQ